MLRVHSGRLSCFCRVVRSVGLRKFIDLLLRGILRNSKTFLNLADKLLLLAIDHSQVVVSQLSPLRFYLAHRLLPFAFDLIPVHLEPPLDGMADSYLLLHSQPGISSPILRQTSGCPSRSDSCAGMILKTRRC